MKCKDGHERVFNEVYFIPSLRSNIISIGQLTEEGSKVVIRGEYMWIFDKNERLLMKVKRLQNRLYKLIIETENYKCLMTKVDQVSKLFTNGSCKLPSLGINV
ncbi:MAG: hypothetical protein Q8829_02740 [Candidatus Phytoplasma australasiaticum]|nr:hypothetical protein [Candidatus Phytoplasma australasiaticum]